MFSGVVAHLSDLRSLHKLFCRAHTMTIVSLPCSHNISDIVEVSFLCSFSDVKMEKFATVSMHVPGKVVQWICIWFSFHTGHNAKETLVDLRHCFQRRTYSKTTVYHWYSMIRQGRTRLNDILRSGHPRTARTLQNQQRCCVIVHNNRRVRIEDLSAQLGMSYGSVFNILHKDLNMKKKSAKLVPHLLTPAQRAARMQFCREFLGAYRRDRRFLEWILTMDEALFYVYDPRSNMESKEWMQPGENRPQVVRREQSVQKLMVIPFFNHCGLLHVEFYRNLTITQRIFLPLLVRIRHYIRVRRGCRIWLHRDRFMLHMDNALAHQGRFIRDAITDWNCPRLRHPAYSPDLSPCDFFLFPFLKRRIRGRRFPDLDRLQNAVSNEIGAIPQIAWQQCFDDWVRHCRKCLRFNGHYFEGMH